MKIIPYFAGIGPWVDVRNYASINAAVTAIGITQTTLLVPNIQTLTANLTIPSTLNLKIIKGGYIVKASTYTLTINGPSEIGHYQVFSGFSAGDVTFGSGSVKEVNPRWFGAKGDGVTDDTVAIQSAIDSMSIGGTLLIPSGNIFLVSGSIALNYSKSNTTILLYGQIKYSGTGTALKITGNNITIYWGGYSKIFRDYTISGAINAALVGNGLHITGKNIFNYNPNITGFQRGIYYDGTTGCGYNNAYSPILTDNLIGVDFRNNGGWANEIVTFGGRIGISSGFSSYTDSRYINILDSSINGIRFYGTSVEGATNIPERKIYCAGHDNGFYELRWEGINGGTDVEFTATSDSNRLHYGSFIEQIKVTDNGTWNELLGNYRKKGSGLYYFSIKTITADYSPGNEPYILGDATGGNIIVTILLASSIKGAKYTIKKIDSSANIITVYCSGNDTIDGAASVILTAQYQYVTIVSNGVSAWQIVDMGGIKQAANADTSGATLAALETEVNELKGALRQFGIIAP